MISFFSRFLLVYFDQLYDWPEWSKPIKKSGPKGFIGQNGPLKNSLLECLIFDWLVEISTIILPLFFHYHGPSEPFFFLVNQKKVFLKKVKIFEPFFLGREFWNLRSTKICGRGLVGSKKRVRYKVGRPRLEILEPRLCECSAQIVRNLYVL